MTSSRLSLVDLTRLDPAARVQVNAEREIGRQDGQAPRPHLRGTATAFAHPWAGLAISRIDKTVTQPPRITAMRGSRRLPSLDARRNKHARNEGRMRQRRPRQVRRSTMARHLHSTIEWAVLSPRSN